MIVRDKLQLLGYTSTFCSTYGLKPISPLYFAVPASNGLDQLNYLALLVHWLCEEAGHVFLKPDAFNDDPNAIAATLLQQVHQDEISRETGKRGLGRGRGYLVLLCSSFPYRFRVPFFFVFSLYPLSPYFCLTNLAMAMYR